MTWQNFGITETRCDPPLWRQMWSCGEQQSRGGSSWSWSAGVWGKALRWMCNEGFSGLTKKDGKQVSRRLMSTTRGRNHDSSPRIHTWVGSQIQSSLMKARFPLGRTYTTTEGKHSCVCPSLSLKEPMAIFQCSEHQRERSTQLFRGLLNIGSELIHFQETPNANVTPLLEWRPEEVRISSALTTS